MQDLTNKIESLLFYQSEPIKLKKIAEILDSNLDEIENSLKELEEKRQDGGIRLIRDDEKVSLTTSPENSEIIEKIKKDEQERDLSKAALETLTIILYLGPIKKSKIDYIRGVNSQFSLRSLLVKGLIEKEVNKEDERSYIYKPTIDLLSYLGISKREDLPEYESVRNDIENFIQNDISNEEENENNE